MWDSKIDDMPVHGTIASQFNDHDEFLLGGIMDQIVEKTGSELVSTFEITREMSEKIFVIPLSVQDTYPRYQRTIEHTISGSMSRLK